MTLRHGNRIRKNGGEQMVRELQAAEASDDLIGGLAEDEIRQGAREICLNRGSAPRDDETCLAAIVIPV